MNTLLLPSEDNSKRTMLRSEAAARADFSQIRYAQCWEDADVLLEALDIEPGEVCLSIGSAGDNTLALLTRQPERVIAIDLNPVQPEVYAPVAFGLLILFSAHSIAALAVLHTRQRTSSVVMD